MLIYLLATVLLALFCVGAIGIACYPIQCSEKFRRQIKEMREKENAEHNNKI